ncbi:hypothetical protein D3C80_913430 [compost metagenome]
MVVRNLVPVGQGLEVRVVGHHGDDVHRQLADALAVEQVVEAVIGLGDHDHHFGPVVGRSQLEQHAEGFATLGKACPKAGFVKAVGLAKLHPNEEAPRQPIIEGMMLGDIALLLVQVARYHIHRAEQARTVSGKNPGVRCSAHDNAP